MIKSVTAALACGVCVMAMAAPAQAQTRQYRIPAGSLKSALDAYARQSGRQIIYKIEEIRRARSPGSRGSSSADAALAAILAGTGFRAKADSSGALAIIRATIASADTAADPSVEDPSNPSKRLSADAVPEILVKGRRDWTLNTGIERTRDDAQPYQVFSKEDIKKSGSVSLDQFLRDYLNSNSQPTTVDQPVQTNIQGQSAVNLRGLTRGDTLILVDGRRQPGINNGQGDVDQAPITNIPLAAIERIEVLASSASGIYGAGATGGVINIILRRDYNGGQISATYADTTDFKAADKRVDLTLGKSLEGGRTNLSLTASYRKADPLLAGDRTAFVLDPLRQALRNDPTIFVTPPYAALPNFRRSPAGGSPPAALILDPQYGGGSINPGFLFIPSGYRGPARDGIAPLLASAGQYNLDLGNNAGNGGKFAPILYGNEQISGTFAVRREMNSWLRIYAEASGSVYNNTTFYNLNPTQVVLPANAPNNPFTSNIVVSFPSPGYERTARAKNTQTRFVGGAIAKLPYEWQAILDASYSHNFFTLARPRERIPSSEIAKLYDGTYDIFQDTSSVVFPFQVIPVLSPDNAFGSKTLTTTLKVAGPLPIALPGGRPTLVLNVERTRDDYSAATAYTDDGQNTFFIQYTPERNETLTSVYGEVRLPLTGSSNKIPLVQGLEATVAARFERYRGEGAGTNFTCFNSNSGLPVGTNLADACKPETLNIVRQTTGNTHIDPTFSLKWTVSRDLVIRGSYATGYLPPHLNQLIKVPGTVFLAQGDPLRGGEVIGTPAGGVYSTLSGFTGGNPDVKPERSKTFSVGMIATPRFIPTLRFSADYTDILKKDVYSNPFPFLFDTSPAGPANFVQFLQLFPERVVRGPASGGFAVGPITSIDASIINLAQYHIRTIDFALDYSLAAFGGTFDVSSTATRNLEQSSKVFGNSPSIEGVGVLPAAGGQGTSPFLIGNIKWKGNASIRWSNKDVTVGVRGRYFDGYYLRIDKAVDLDTGSATVPSQLYFDVFGSVRLPERITLRGGVNNVFSKYPPIIQTGRSGFGDPRLANFYLTLAKDF